MMWGTVVAVLGWACVVGVSGHSSGAPSSACSSMTPNHGPYFPNVQGYDNKLNTYPSKFFIYTYKNGTVHLTGEELFKGFILRAKPANGGSFSIPNNAPYEAVQCNGPVAYQAVTHTNPTLKSTVSVIWSGDKNVEFEATVVPRGEVYIFGIVDNPLERFTRV